MLAFREVEAPPACLPLVLFTLISLPPSTFSGPGAGDHEGGLHHHHRLYGWLRKSIECARDTSSSLLCHLPALRASRVQVPQHIRCPSVMEVRPHEPCRPNRLGYVRLWTLNHIFIWPVASHAGALRELGRRMEFQQVVPLRRNCVPQV